MSVCNQIWLKKFDSGPASKEFQSRAARSLLQVACRSSGVELKSEHLILRGPELIDHVDKNFGLSISITHCAQIVAVAVGRGRLGLDCEPMGKIRNWQGIADQFFTSEEANTVANASTNEQERVFLRHWVLKESYIKSIKGSVFGDLNKLTLTNQSKAAHVKSSYSNHNKWAWVGSFAGCVLGVYCTNASEPELAFYETTDLSDTRCTTRRKQVPGSFIPINQYLSTRT